MTEQDPNELGSGDPIAPSQNALVGVAMKNGYRMRDHAEVYLGDILLTNENLTHKKALDLLASDPSTFQDVMDKHRYRMDDPYWAVELKKTSDQ